MILPSLDDIQNGRLSDPIGLLTHGFGMVQITGTELALGTGTFQQPHPSSAPNQKEAEEKTTKNKSTLICLHTQ